MSTKRKILYPFVLYSIGSYIIIKAFFVFFRKDLTLHERIPKFQTNSTIKDEPIPAHRTNHTKFTRKRKRSVSKDIDANSSRMVLRKRKPDSNIENEKEERIKKTVKKKSSQRSKGIEPISNIDLQ